MSWRLKTAPKQIVKNGFRFLAFSLHCNCCIKLNCVKSCGGKLSWSKEEINAATVFCFHFHEQLLHRSFASFPYFRTQIEIWLFRLHKENIRTGEWKFLCMNDWVCFALFKDPKISVLFTTHMDILVIVGWMQVLKPKNTHHRWQWLHCLSN